MSVGSQPLLMLAGLTVAAVVVYIGLFLLGNAYSVRTGWNPPRGTEETNWTLRRNAAFTFGLIASVVCALGSWLWLTSLTAQLVAMGEGVLLAAAGASDLRRFHLPLPFTMGGIAIAIAVAVAAQTPLAIMLFALGWALALILLHAVTSKGSMQLGDHIATVWIALASPFNGMIALVAGDLSNVFLARARGLKGKKVAAAGAWLIFCAALISVPPYVTWRAQTAPVTQLSDPIAARSDGQSTSEAIADFGAIADSGAIAAAFAPWQTETTSTLITLTRWAGDATARVVLVDPGEARKAAARQAAVDIAQYAALAHELGAGRDAGVAESLDDLAAALNHYDVEGVGNANQRLLAARTQLTALTTPVFVVGHQAPTPDSR